MKKSLSIIFLILMLTIGIANAEIIRIRTDSFHAKIIVPHALRTNGNTLESFILPVVVILTKPNDLGVDCSYTLTGLDEDGDPEEDAEISDDIELVNGKRGNFRINILDELGSFPSYSLEIDCEGGESEMEFVREFEINPALLD